MGELRIIELLPENKDAVRQCAALLVEVFREHHPNVWPDMDSALEEVDESFAPDRISRIAVDDAGLVQGWVGGISQYDGHAWELHPIAVRLEHQRRGIGRALVADLEEQVKRRGGSTIFLGTDDENNQTSLGGVDLYPNIFEHVANIRNLNNHPYEFFLKMGFTIVGVMPDANGFGKPDIFMAKRVAGT